MWTLLSFIISSILFFTGLFLLIIIIGVFQRVLSLFFKEPERPSRMARILGPILIFLSFLELTIPFIVALLMLGKFELADSDFKTLGSLFLVCFSCFAVTSVLSFDYYKYYYLKPKRKQNNTTLEAIREKINAPTTEESEQFKPKYFSNN